MVKFNKEKQLFVFNEELWQPNCEKSHLLPAQLKVKEVENGMILPLRNRTDLKVLDSLYEGGVCDEQGEFITGHQRATVITQFTNLSCLRGYTVDQPINHKHETVVFGGMLYGHFGHYIFESMGRLWRLSNSQYENYKIAFILQPHLNGEFPNQEVFDTLGIDMNRVVIISEPTKFDKIIIPDEAVYLGTGYLDGYEKTFDLMLKKVKPSEHKKIYLSRTQFNKRDGMNEEYFEEFYRKRGFHIAYPEQLSFIDQISLINGADEIATTIGTLQLMMLFCHEGAKVTILNRTKDTIMPSTWVPLEMRNLDYSIIDIDFNILPAPHVGFNIFLYGPTRHWIDYLNAREIEYTEDEVSLDLHLKPLLYDYIKAWGENYLDPNSYKKVRNNDLIDVLANIQKICCNKKIERKNYVERDSVTNLRKEKDNFKKECDKVKKERDNLNKEITLFKKDRDLAIKESKLFKKERDIYKKQLDKLTKEQAKLKEENKKFKAQNQKSLNRIKSMENSHSWKLTAPIRFIMDLFKR